MKTDKLIICDRCKSDACYTYEVSDKINAYSCFGCGFQTNSLMRDGEILLEQQLEDLPELYKDLVGIGEDGKVWIPQTVHITENGMVFIKGTSKDNWKWSAVKSKKITQEEKTRFPVQGEEGKYYRWKMDMTTEKMFERHDFIGALIHINIVPE